MIVTKAEKVCDDTRIDLLCYELYETDYGAREKHWIYSDQCRSKAQGEAEAYAAKKKVEAGLTPLEKAKIEMETKIGIAKALASVKFPEWMVVAGGGNGNGGVNPFDAVGLQSLYDLSDKMSAEK